MDDQGVITNMSDEGKLHLNGTHGDEEGMALNDGDKEMGEIEEKQAGQEDTQRMNRKNES